MVWRRQQFFEQYSHEPNIATPRFWITHGVKIDGEKRLAPARRRKLGHDALGVIEGYLADGGFFAGGHYSVADIALYAYTRVAGEGGFDPAGYPAVRAWIGRVAARPGHVPVTRV